MGRSYHRSASLLAVTVALAAVGASACDGNGNSSPRVALSESRPADGSAPLSVAASSSEAPGPELSSRARVALDSGNAQMREKRYAEALVSYRRAVKEAPGHVAPEFGVYMAAQRLGNTILADSAQRIINAHTRGSPTWTDSTMRNVHGERALPKTHPKI